MAKVIHQTVERCEPFECPYCKRHFEDGNATLRTYCDALNDVLAIREGKDFPDNCPLEEEGSLVNG